jgi:hypothetical protein
MIRGGTIPLRASFFSLHEWREKKERRKEEEEEEEEEEKERKKEGRKERGKMIQNDAMLRHVRERSTSFFCFFLRRCSLAELNGLSLIFSS